MRMRAVMAGCLLVVLGILSVRETRCGSECQAAAALFAANAASIHKAEAATEAMPGMEDCPMAKMAAAAKGDVWSAPDTCSKRMVHASDEARTEEHVRAPEFGIAAVTLDSLTEFGVPAVVEREIADASPPERRAALVSLQTTIRI